MYFRIKGSFFSENVYKEIEAFTNYGILYLQKIKYDENSKSLSIPIERIKIENSKKSFFGMVTSYIYDKNIKIPTSVVIRNITEYTIENYLNDPKADKIHILFGMSITPKTNEIYIGSVEEDRGTTCYSIKLKVSEIDIEINDR